MKIVIDEKVCRKHKLSLEEFLVALCYRQIEDVVAVHDNLYNKEVLVRKDDNTYVTQHWSEVMDEILCDSMAEEDDEEHLISLAKQMRELYPQGKIQGTPYYYRCNNTEVVRKLKKFFLQYGNTYTDDEILDATKRFVASFQGDYKYLPLIKYFISKLKPVQEEDGTVHNVEFSPLADFLENSGEGEEETITSDDWLMNARN